MIEKFLGNYDTVKTLSDWLENWYHKDERNHYVILFSVSGNGKTFLAKLLAQEMNLELQTIDADDITSQEEMNDYVKKLDLRSLSGKEKLILVENYEEIPYQKQLYEWCKVCSYPILYTTTKYPNKKEMSESELSFFENGKFLKLEKPLSYLLVNLMQERLKFLGLQCDTKKLEEIASKSTSVRSALNSCLTQLSNESIQEFISIYDKLEQLAKRGLSRDINELDLLLIFRSIQGYENSDFEVMNRFCELNLVFKQRWKEKIDTFLLNHMREPLEQVEFEYKKKENNKPNKESKEDPKKLQPPPSIADYL